MVVNYRCIGKGVTNSNGVAQMTHSSSDNGVTFTQLANNGYEGVGKGKVDIVASMDKIINSGSVQSEPYPITDAIYYDKGILNDPQTTDIWYNQQNAVNTRGDTYSEITENGGTAILRLKTANSIDKTNICVEFDVWQDGATSNNFMSFVNTTMSTYTGTYNLGNLNLQTETWNHIKLEIDNNGVITPNGLTSAQKTLSVNTNKMLFCFLTNGDITKIRFKDWRVYPI